MRVPTDVVLASDERLERLVVAADVVAGRRIAHRGRCFWRSVSMIRLASYMCFAATLGEHHFVRIAHDGCDSFLLAAAHLLRS